MECSLLSHIICMFWYVDSVCGCVPISRAAAKIEIRVLEQIRDIVDDGQE